jgi:hypothetical protein
MVVKDAIKQGYPFAESIASALPICDEFLVSDGYSTDGTFKMLQRISSLNRKVRVYQDEWSMKGLPLIAYISNNLRKKCKSDYLFYVQAPEIVHEDSVKMINAFPELFPHVDTFTLPYMTVISNFKIHEEFRLRFCRNISRINLTGDAWAFSVTKAFIRSEALRSIGRPKKLLNYIGRGIEFKFASSLNNVRSIAVCLPQPIFRYPALFKENYIERCKGHAHHLNMPIFLGDINKLEQEQGETFFEKLVQMHRQGSDVHYQGDLGTFKIEDHPKIMQELITKRTAISRYFVRDTVLDTIANA